MPKWRGLSCSVWIWIEITADSAKGAGISLALLKLLVESGSSSLKEDDKEEDILD